MLGVAMAEISNSSPKCIFFILQFSQYSQTYSQTLYLSASFIPRCDHDIKFCQGNMHLLGVCWNYASSLIIDRDLCHVLVLANDSLRNLTQQKIEMCLHIWGCCLAPLHGHEKSMSLWSNERHEDQCCHTGPSPYQLTSH